MAPDQMIGRLLAADERLAEVQAHLNANAACAAADAGAADAGAAAAGDAAAGDAARAAKRKGVKDPEKYLRMSADLALETLRELGSPGCEWV